MSTHLSEELIRQQWKVYNYIVIKEDIIDPPGKY